MRNREVSSSGLGWVLGMAGLVVAGCGGSDDPAGAAGATGGTGGAAAVDGGSGGSGGGADSGSGGGTGDAATTPPDYEDGALWLCRPDLPSDVCHENLDATILHADGSTEVEQHVFATDPKVDCFYVYPTVSQDPSANSDLVAGDEEKTVVKQQAARLTRVCDVYAPLYRQVSLSSLLGSLPPGTAPGDRELAYADVVAAWERFLAIRGTDRPFVLVGHSQGTAMLTRLIQDRIDGDAALRGKLVSALLIGGAVVVPEGADVGGAFQNVPLCRSETQTGCAVAYSTFRATAPPPDNSLFGRPRGGAPGAVGCNNPAALAGGPATQTPYFPTTGALFPPGTQPISTPFVTLPDFLRGECVSKNGFNYLELTILADPTDPRPDDIGGDFTPEWGLHLVDVHVAMGDLVRLVEAEAAALP